MTIQRAISAHIQVFTAELEVLVRSAALEAVAAALGGHTVPAVPAVSPPARRRRRRARIAKPATIKTASVASPAAKLVFKRKKGAKRTAEQLGQIDAAVLGYVRANAGKGVEHMAKTLGVPSRDLKARVAHLIGTKKIKKTGVRRATKYSAA